MKSLATLDPIKWVREKPERFFHMSSPDGVGLLAYVMADVLVLGGGECVIRAVQSWNVIGSNRSWLVHPEHEIPELFRHVVVAPGHGEHSMRAEVLVAAFATDVAVKAGGASILGVQGQLPSEEVLAAVSDIQHALLFRL